jgi:HSP20 family protein
MAEKAKEKETKAVAPWRPFMDVTRWERDMERMMEDFFGRRMRPWFPERWLKTEGAELTAPAVDVYEEKDDIVVKAELPGMEKEQHRSEPRRPPADDQGGEEKRGRDQRGELL